MIKVDLDSVAETLVVQCMRVKPGEIIWVAGGLFCFELLEDLAVAISRQNAYFVLTPYTDRLTKRLLLEPDINFLETPPKSSMELAGCVDGQISLDRIEDPRIFQSVPEERIGAQRKSRIAINNILLERKVRWTGMGYPTPEKAEMYGVRYEEFHDMFWKAVTTDYQDLYTRGKAVVDILRKGNTVSITTEKTDLEFQVAGRPVYIDDGVISEEDISMGDIGNNLPAGEVFCAPIESSAQGRAYFDVAFYKGEKITGIDCVFKKGKVVSVTCEENEDLFKGVLSHSHGQKDVIGELGIGLNPEVTRPTGYVITDEKIIGTIHIALGENREFGGENESSLHWDLVMMHPTVKVDGTIIMEDGDLVQ
jgi:aminopeptidase